MRFLVFLLALFIPLFSYAEDEEELVSSTPDQLATLTSRPNTLIGGLVSPLSGQLSLKKTDLIVKGAQNIFLTRVYIPPYMPCDFPKHRHSQEEHDKLYLYRLLSQNYRGWQFLPHLRLEYNQSKSAVRLTSPNGTTLDFNISEGETTLVSPHYAISNTSGDEPSGQFDPRNTRIKSENGKIIVYAPDGNIRIYQNNLLQKEVLPNGKVIKYHYEQGRPIYVESLDPGERYVYASMRISGSPKEGSCHFTSSSGQTADYSYQRRPLHIDIRAGNHKKELDVKCPPLLTEASSPFYHLETLKYCDRFLLCSYSGKDKIFSSVQGGFGKSPHYRVNKLSLPVGKDNSLQQVYEINYNPPIPGEREGWTEEIKDDGTRTVYRFSKDLLLTSIQTYNGSFKKQKIYSWTDRQWLKSIEILDKQNKLLSKKSFDYDSFGNPILEIFTGDLTGSGQKESCTIRREFSQDGRHLLLKEEHENGKTVCYDYLPKTNLITAKITKDHEKILIREFSKYDDCHNLIQTISDDGRNQRTITNYALRQEPPFLHMPEWIEEKYEENNSENLLKRTHLSYDVHGNIASEEVYNADGELAYTIYKEYNERGDLLSETNPLGQKACYQYDSRGFCINETNFSANLQKTKKFDANSRLSEESERGSTTHTTLFEYDSYDRLIKKTDSFGNPIHYTYDLTTNLVAKTDFPNGVATESTYDFFGRLLTSTDANGNKTSYRTNAYGSIVEVVHPDKGIERYRYAKDGSLLSHEDQEGLTVYYERDALERILSKTYVFNDETIAKESFIYNGFNISSKTDKEGHLTKYSYDGAKRLVREEFLGRITDYAYDPLGYLKTIKKESLYTHYKRDLEGRILEETKTDAFENVLHHISYTYDSDGNKASVTRSVNGKKSTDAFVYDSFGRLIEHKDPCLFFTKHTYNENHINSLGQRVLQIASTDPRHITTVSTTDVFKHTVKKEVLNPIGTILSSEDKCYDAHGNVTCQKNHVYENGQFQNTQIINYTYTPTHHLETLTQGSKDSRTTAFTYTLSGKVASKILPDGVTLSYKYDPFGFLRELQSSDEQIHHSFKYNALGHLNYAGDENNFFSREIDPFGNVVQEKFSNGAVLDKEYDRFDRLTRLKVHGLGEISYSYDPLFLKAVTRYSNTCEELYTHRYETYDLAGNLLTEQLIGGLGQIAHQTNLRGQKTAITSPYFTQSCSYDSVGNLIENISSETKHEYSYDGLSELISESQPDKTYAYDSLYNRIEHKVNDLNQPLGVSFDLNGNQTVKHTPSEEFSLKYDPLGRLIEAASDHKKIVFSYDPLGRRLSKVVNLITSLGLQEIENESYLYNGYDEIGAFDSEKLKNFRVLVRDKTIAIELDGQIFAPLLDVQDNVRRLVSLDTGLISESYEFTAFGQVLSEMSLLNPWCFAAKRIDPELGLIYFGKRYYDPEFARWLTPDPAGFIDSVNLYQYVFNNPFRYRDPDGQLAWLVTVPLIVFGSEVAFVSFSAIITPIICGAITGAAVMYGYKVMEKQETHDTNDRFDNEEYCDNYDHWDNVQEDLSMPQGKKGNKLAPNGDQNTQAGEARQEAERITGKKFDTYKENKFHKHVTKQGYDYHELVDIGVDVLNGIIY